MFELPFTPLSDDEFAATLQAALRAAGGGVTHAGACHMAAVVAEHLVERLAVAGVTAVRIDGVKLTE